MPHPEDTNARLDALEAHIAHQDQVIEELSEVAAKQWSEIAALKERLEQLRNKFREMEAGMDGDPGEESPPPHY
ncbi:MAG: SlyX family protein [Alphaproteobacteria bacterium]